MRSTRANGYCHLMARLASLRRLWNHLLAYGAYPGEPETQRGKRRIIAGALVVGVALGLLGMFDALDEGLPGVAVVDGAWSLSSVLALGALRFRPHWFVWIFNCVNHLAVWIWCIEAADLRT